MKIAQFRWTAETGWGALPPFAFEANLVLAFSGAEYFRTPECYEELRRFFPVAHIVGCSSSGSIFDTHISDEDVVVTAIQFERGNVRLARTTVSPGEKLEDLAARLMGELEGPELRHAFVLSDGLSVNGSDLAKGLNAAGITVTGGLAGDGPRFTSTWVMADAPSAQNVIAVIGFFGDLKSNSGCVAGWREFGAERLVTRSCGNVVYEIDYKPALSVYTAYLGPMAADLPGSGLRFPLSIRPTEHDEPVIRTLLAVDVDAQSLTFAGDVPQGIFCRLMKTNVDLLIDGSGMAADEAKPEANGRPSLCLVVSCVGRRLVMGQLTEEELDIVRERIGPVPAITGFYSYGELAPFAGLQNCPAPQPDHDAYNGQRALPVSVIVSPPAATESHKLLRRQLRRAFGTEIEPDGDWGRFLAAVSDAYHQADQERQVIENALEMSAQELTAANIKLRLIIDNAPAGILMLDRQMRCIFASRRWLEDRRVNLQDIVGKEHFEIVPELADRWKEAFLRCQAGATERREEDPIPQADGSVEWVKWETCPWYEPNGSFGGILVMSENITDRKRAEEQMRIAAVAFQSRDGMIVTDARGVILQVNQAFTDVTGYSASEVVGRTSAILKSEKQDAAFYRIMWEALTHEGCWAGEIWNRRKDGGIYPEWLSISSVTNSAGKITHYLGTYSDIRDPKEAERKILELAFYDPLTGLPNRRLLQDRLNHAMVSSAREGLFGALLLLDLDHFKTLNDTRGHHLGDQLLVEIARRLSGTLRESDSAARLGGDEFVVLLEDLHKDKSAAASRAEMIAEKIRAAISLPVVLQGHEYYATSSIGVTLFRDRGEGADSLFRQADLALYQAKDAGRNAIRFYSPTMQALADERAKIEAGLRRALVLDEFVLYYQPQVDLTGALVGAEALIRWKPKEQAMISPADFIPAAEDNGLIVPISSWVVETACKLLAAWKVNPATKDLRLSVNISARHFHEPNFVKDIISTIERIGAPPSRIVFELTEGLLLKNVDKVIKTMELLKEFGVGFSIDDFGIGYSSLSYLKRLPLDQIKIDRSFVHDLENDSDDRAIVQAIISLGQSLGLQVVAEGVENAAQKDFLASRGCHVYQGFLFSKPLPLEEFSRIVLDAG